jgi:hypothetical protein
VILYEIKKYKKFCKETAYFLAKILAKKWAVLIMITIFFTTFCSEITTFFTTFCSEITTSIKKIHTGTTIFSSCMDFFNTCNCLEPVFLARKTTDYITNKKLFYTL